MSKATKSTPATSHEATPPHHDKGFLNLAGEAFVVLGAEIVEGKDKVIEVVVVDGTSVMEEVVVIAHSTVVEAIYGEVHVDTS